MLHIPLRRAPRICLFIWCNEPYYISVRAPLVFLKKKQYFKMYNFFLHTIGFLFYITDNFTWLLVHQNSLISKCLFPIYRHFSFSLYFIVWVKCACELQLYLYWKSFINSNNNIFTFSTLFESFLFNISVLYFFIVYSVVFVFLYFKNASHLIYFPHWFPLLNYNTLALIFFFYHIFYEFHIFWFWVHRISVFLTFFLNTSWSLSLPQYFNSEANVTFFFLIPSPFLI